jgi:pimeloyl-ACP methyl ester carboxylesterase
MTDNQPNKPKKKTITAYKNNGSDILIIFLHGWGGSKKSFDPIIQSLHTTKKSDQTQELADLEAKKFDTLQLDLPGFGDNTMPPAEGWNTDQYAVWFKEWIDEFLLTLHLEQGELPKAEGIDFNIKKSYKKIVLYGHSFGCRVIVKFLLQNPDWNHPVILTGAAGIKHPPPSRAKLAQLVTKIIKPIKSFIPSKIKKLVLKKIFKAHDWAEAPEALKNTLTKTLNEADIREMLPQIQNQILLLWGAKDTYTPLKSAHIFENNLPNAQLVIFDEGKHGTHYTHKAEIVAEIEKFLAH